MIMAMMRFVDGGANLTVESRVSDVFDRLETDCPLEKDVSGVTTPELLDGHLLALVAFRARWG